MFFIIPNRSLGNVYFCGIVCNSLIFNTLQNQFLMTANNYNSHHEKLASNDRFGIINKSTAKLAANKKICTIAKNWYFIRQTYRSRGWNQ